MLQIHNKNLVVPRSKSATLSLVPNDSTKSHHKIRSRASPSLKSSKTSDDLPVISSNDLNHLKKLCINLPSRESKSEKNNSCSGNFFYYYYDWKWDNLKLFSCQMRYWFWMHKINLFWFQGWIVWSNIWIIVCFFHYFEHTIKKFEMPDSSYFAYFHCVCYVFQKFTIKIVIDYSFNSCTKWT